MAARDMWKMLHLLNIYGPSLEREVVRAAGITCDPDTIYPLISSGVIEAIPNDVPWYQASHYRLSNTAMGLAQSFLLANKRDTATDVRVDEARAFVIMPFSEQWSSNVYSNLIEPAVRAAGFQCIRGDLVVRSGDLTANILNEILIMGIAVVDVSARNPNVFYELGLCHAIGKDTLLIKQAGTVMPADLAGAHYSEYTLTDIKRGRDDLEKMLNDWAVKNSVKRT
ncbi:MAG: hypothetical protein KDE53_26890 [Caldilineaceae bacterium]|nr:hypothetical protein [Caldilineaceae bacterium]